MGVRRCLVALGAAGLLCYAVAVLALEPLRPQNLAWGLVLLAPLFGVAVYAGWRRPDLPITRVLLLGASSWAAFSGLTHLCYALAGRGHTGAGLVVGAAASTGLGAMAGAAAATFFTLYPDGVVRHGYERWFLRLVWAGAAVLVTAHLLTARSLVLDVEYDTVGVANPLRLTGARWPADPADAAAGNVFVVVGVLVLVRYLRSGPLARRQIRWLLLVPFCAIALYLVGLLLDWAGVESAWFVTGTVGQYVFLGLLPAVLVISIMRHRLLDVDVLLRKSLVYGVLWTLIGAGYVMTAAAVGIAGGQRLPVALAVLLTVAASVLFQPARRWLEGLADRLVFGRRVPGHTVVEQLGRQLEAAVDTAELMDRLATAVRTGMRLHWADAVLHLRPAGTVVATSTDGTPRAAAALTVPIAHGDETLGVLECGPKLAGAFTAEDTQLVRTLGRQAALAVHNARLAGELAARVDDVRRQAAELSASRARIVQAGDSERRRIERDLHDGAQQQLVALLAKLRLARNQLGRDPAKADRTLAELEGETASLHRDLVELTRGIHPAVLTDRGLAEAIRSRAQRLPLDVRITVDGEVAATRYADEIEGAAYFVCSEALTNVLKHARATRTDVVLSGGNGRLRVDIRDDGIGMNGTAGSGGHGLANMADRLAALGGALRVDSSPGAGTTIRAELPVTSGGRDG